MYKPVQFIAFLTSLIWHYNKNRSELISLHCNSVTRSSLQTTLVLSNIYKDIGTRMNQFMSKMMSAVLLTILDGFAYNKPNLVYI